MHTLVYPWHDTLICTIHTYFGIISLSSVLYYLLQLVFSACVAVVNIRPVLHHCVVIFFWSSGIMECTCILFTFENGVPLMRQGASVVWHNSILLMNSFNKTKAAVFSCRLCFLRAFLFISLIIHLNVNHYSRSNAYEFNFVLVFYCNKNAQYK